METMNRHENDKPVREVEGVRLTRQQCGWQSEKLPVHGCRVVDNTGRLVAADVYDEEIAEQIVADHNNAADYQASLTRLTAQRNRYREQVEVLSEALRELRKWFEGGVPIMDRAACEGIRQQIDDALAVVAEESES